MRDEIVGDLRQRHVGDIELMFADQPEKQVEGPFEDVQPNPEPLPRPELSVVLVRHGLSHR